MKAIISVISRIRVKTDMQPDRLLSQLEYMSLNAIR